MNLSSFHQALDKWYQANGRHHLPWRQTHDAYTIWVSEVMLQQTQVKTVLDRFYHPFLTSFPTINDLAKADLQHVLHHWQGLGYYTRARNLHAAAQGLASQKVNTLPSSEAELIALPGIGKNTARAIMAFAFNQPVAILEANVKRVITRIFALKNPNMPQLWQRAEELLNTKNPFDYNQAMMDLGSQICTPKAPLCSQCPAAAICEGKTNPLDYPQKKKSIAIPTRNQNIVLFTDTKNRYAMRPRETRLLNGLWQFAEYNQTDRIVFEGKEFTLKHAIKLGEISHLYSHFKLVANVYSIPFQTLPKHWQMKSNESIKALPLSRIEKKILGFLDKH